MSPLLILFLLCMKADFSWEFIQKIDVSGEIFCDGIPISAKIELMEYDYWSFNDKLADSFAENGTFQISGQEDDWIFSISPFLNVIHECNTKPNCTRIHSFGLLESYIDRKIGGLRLEISASLQKVNISGQVVCDGKPMSAKIYLMEYDFYEPNDLLYETTSDNQGNFHVFGEHDEIFSIEPYLRVIHTCHTKPKCTRTQEFNIPTYLIGKNRGGFILEVNETESWNTNQCY